jgi:hypothetical protein
MEETTDAKEGRMKKLTGRARSRCGRPKSIELSTPPAPNIYGELQLDLPLDKIKPLAESYKSSVSSYKKLKWALSNKEKLQILVDKLRGFNVDLEGLTARYLASALKKPEMVTVVTEVAPVPEKLRFMVPFPRNREYIEESQVRELVEK